MPTGYTSDVADGKVTTLRDFALLSARGMGALIMMRDEPWDAPIPERFEPDTKYYDEKITELGEAGLQGQEYEVARENVGTLIERTNAAEALLAEAVAGLGRITSDHTSDPNYPQGHAWDASCDACNGREIARTLLALIIQTGDGNISSISQSARTKEPIALARPDTEPSGQEGGAA